MKKFSFSLFLAMMALMVCAAPITKQQAREKAQSFLNLRGKQVVSEARRAPGVTSTDSNQPLYVFNATDNKGFVIIAGDDRAETVLGYSDTGSFNEDNLPDNLRFWLKLTEEEIKAMPSSPKMQAAAPRKVTIHSAIKPLIKTQWAQGEATEKGYIYNTLTPTINVKVDENTTVPFHCITGCVATAGAQIMYYHCYPKQATQPVPGYTPNTTIGAVDGLPAIQFDWEKMKETYSSSDVGTDSERAVSELMLYCGYAVQMNYGLSGSSSSEYTLVTNMVKYFDYDPSWKYISRSSYSIGEWDAVIYGELKAGRPIIVSGQGNNGGHAFICDGYDGAGLYHFNWGWGGLYDGYFKLNDTNPYQGEKVYSDGTIDTGYILDVTAIIGIQPNTGQEPTGSGDGAIVANAMNPQLEGTVISALLQNPNNVAAKLALGLGELNADGTVTPIDTQYSYFKNYELPNGNNWMGELTFDISTYRLSDGTHQLVFISIANDDTEWVRCLPSNLRYEVTIKDGNVVSIIEHPYTSIEVSNIAFTGNRYATVAQSVAVTVANKADEYTGPLFFFASTSTDNKGDAVYSVGCAIEGGQSEVFNMYFTPQKTGTYTVWVCTDASGNNVIGTAQVEIRDLPTYKVTLTMESLEFDAKPMATAYLRVKNNSDNEFFDGFMIQLFIRESNGYTYLKNVKTKAYQILSGETKTIPISLPNLEAGNTYNIEIYYKPNVSVNSYNYLCEADFTVTEPEYAQGDVNHDGKVNVTDVMLIVNYILNNQASNFDDTLADLNNDGKITVTDVMLMVSAILK